jgi:hypothetical protein
MKAKKLIQLLLKAPPDSRIVIDGLETGYNQVSDLTYINIKKDPDWGPCTAFLDGEFIEADEGEVSEIAIYIK